MNQSSNSLRAKIAAAAAVLACMVTAPNAWTETAKRQLTEEQRAQIEQRLAEIRTRLELSPEQEATLKPILRDSFEKRMALLKDSGLTENGQRPDRQQMRALRDEMARLRKDTEAQVDTVLDERQMAEFRKIQDEMRDQLRERARERRRRR
jgi:hypothetical protein